MAYQVLELQALDDYELPILHLEAKIKELQASYSFGPHEPKGPMDWDRVILEDGTDARYCPPHGSGNPSVAQLYEYESELVGKLEWLKLRLLKAARDEILLLIGVDNL